MKSFAPFHELDNQQALAYSLIRIFLGIALFVRGMTFMLNPEAITELARQNNLHMWYSYITIGHLIGGGLLVIGLMSRIASLLQIPILLGAIFIVHAHQGLTSMQQSLELAVLVLVLLMIFLFFGSGGMSLDRYINETRADEHKNGIHETI